MFYWTGVAFWIAVASGASWLLALLALEAIVCARFVIRRIRLLPNAGFKPEFPMYRTALYIWWCYLVGKADQPVCILNRETGIHAYWPGREDYEESYPA